MVDPTLKNPIPGLMVTSRPSWPIEPDALLVHAAELVLLLDREGIVKHASPNSFRMTGTDAQQLVGTLLHELVHPEDRCAVEIQFCSLRAHAGGAIRLSWRLRHASGVYMNHESTLVNQLEDPESACILLLSQDVTRHKMAEEALRFAEEKYRSIYENAVEGIFQSAPEGIFLSANPSLAHIYGWASPEDLLRGVRDIGTQLYVDPNRRQQFIESVLATGAVRNFVSQVRRKDGSVIWITENARVVRGVHGRVAYFEGTVTDITAQRTAEDALRESQERYSLAVEGFNGGVWDWNLQDGTVYYSSQWKSMLGLLDDQVGPHSDEMFNRVHPRDRELLNQEVQNHVTGQVPLLECEFRMLHHDGDYRWMSLRGKALSNGRGGASRLAGSMLDITSSKKAEEQLIQGALYDVLTGLPNRALFLDRMRRALRRGGRMFTAVLFLDIDRFKIINDSLGHTAGDQLLQMVGQIVEECARPRDTVARLSGDEFGLLMEGIQDVNPAIRAADRILKRFGQPLQLAGREVYPSMSIGIALTHGSSSPEDLLRESETAMYRAKSSGRSHYMVFNEGMHQFAVAHLELESHLRRAIERQEFDVHFQPIVALGSGETAGFESLVRWHHPERGMVSPASFIPLAEETGLIHEIGDWVLQESCRRLANLQKVQSAARRMIISVNLSGRQFSQPELVDRIRTALDTSGIESHRLKLEITETVIMDNPQQTAEKLQELRSMGIGLSIDDFGTGYSSLSYLSQFPVHTLKIDRSFVSRMTEETAKSSIVRTIVGLAKNLGMDVVAEGIETHEQLAALQALDCEFGQGYLFARPLPMSELTKHMLKAGQTTSGEPGKNI